MATARDLLITGLKNAHSMENQAHELLERQAERMTEYPELRDRVSTHLAETKEQLARLEKCLADLDSSPSTIKESGPGFWSKYHGYGSRDGRGRSAKKRFCQQRI